MDKIFFGEVMFDESDAQGLGCIPGVVRPEKWGDEADPDHLDALFHDDPGRQDAVQPPGEKCQCFH